jgi:transcription elongation factor Elf1
MIQTDQDVHGTYRCPVCGHRDTVGIRAGGPARTVTCSYCETLLEVSARNSDMMHFAAQIADGTRRSDIELHS